MILSPSEFSGEQGTWVAGRVVLVRRTTILPENKGKKGKGKGGDQPTEKCEVHLLGGDNTSEVLYVEAWGEENEPAWSSYLLPTIAKNTGQLLTMLPADTPLKRKALIDDHTPVPPASAQELHQFGDRLQLVAGTP